MRNQKELIERLLQVLDCCQWDENCAKFCEFNVSGECVAKQSMYEKLHSEGAPEVNVFVGMGLPEDAKGIVWDSTELAFMDPMGEVHELAAVGLDCGEWYCIGKDCMWPAEKCFHVDMVESTANVLAAKCLGEMDACVSRMQEILGSYKKAFGIEE